MSEADSLITLHEILEKDAASAPVERGFSVFVFGSFAAGSLGRDIDLLITYGETVDAAKARRLREWLAAVVTAAFQRPADICLLSNAEEVEIDFAKHESAHKVLERQ